MSVPSDTESHDNTRHDVLMRLRRAEGQVRGLQRQIENDAACIDVLTQLQATTRALEGAAMLLMAEHLHDCVAGASEVETLQRRAAELSAAIAELVRS
jgi:DNA-binding FrmR family transcriptional regulator